MTAPDWRKALADLGVSVHPAADRFDMMSSTDLDELARDIGKIDHITSPLSIWRETPASPWQLLDGRNRIAALARLSNGEERIAGAVSVANQYEGERTDPLAFVVSANIVRRHLSAEQKRQLITELLKTDPTRSDRATAAIAHVHHETVGRVRTEAEGRGEIRHVEHRTDTKGLHQPAAKPQSRPRLEPDYQRADLPPIVPEHQRPAQTPEPAPAQPTLSPPDTHDAETARRRIALHVPQLLGIDPAAGLEHVADVISRFKFGDDFASKQKIAAARKFARALGVDPFDLVGGRL
jgi:hypothetical protein